MVTMKVEDMILFFEAFTAKWERKKIINYLQNTPFAQKNFFFSMVFIFFLTMLLFTGTC